MPLHHYLHGTDRLLPQCDWEALGGSKTSTHSTSYHALAPSASLSCVSLSLSCFEKEGEAPSKQTTWLGALTAGARQGMAEKSLSTLGGWEFYHHILPGLDWRRMNRLVVCVTTSLPRLTTLMPSMYSQPPTLCKYSIERLRLLLPHQWIVNRQADLVERQPMIPNQTFCGQTYYCVWDSSYGCVCVWCDNDRASY